MKALLGAILVTSVVLGHYPVTVAPALALPNQYGRCGADGIFPGAVKVEVAEVSRGGATLRWARASNTDNYTYSTRYLYRDANGTLVWTPWPTSQWTGQGADLLSIRLQYPNAIRAEYQIQTWNSCGTTRLSPIIQSIDFVEPLRLAKVTYKHDKPGAVEVGVQIDGAPYWASQFSGNAAINLRVEKVGEPGAFCESYWGANAPTGCQIKLNPKQDHKLVVYLACTTQGPANSPCSNIAQGQPVPNTAQQLEVLSFSKSSTSKGQIGRKKS